MRRKTRERKGIFSDARLPVAERYVVAISRGSMLLLGALLIAVVLAAVALNVFLGDSSLLSNGPLSSNHAVLEDDCAACHDAMNAVTSEKCSVCHEKHGDRLGVYTWSAHKIYRSNDFERLAASEHETGCAACHLEHRGREAPITRVSDARCRTCHLFESFNRGHPQFDFATAASVAEPALRFPHISHVRELMRREALVDVEKACLYCHNGRGDGKGFEPLSFEAHCDTCHLTTVVRTPSLPIATDTDTGVLTLAAIRERGAPGTQWAEFMGPGEFRERGGEVSKSPVYHEDPWILENLRILRRELYDDPGLADLLKASADVSPSELPALYEEAIATLDAQALGLRSRAEPEIRRDLETIDQLLDELRRAVRDPLTPFDETKFFLALSSRRTDLDDETANALETLILDLTAVCQQCHRVEDATIARVSEDLRVLERAEFDHRAHILQVRCLECHVEIPIAENLDLSGEVEIDPGIVADGGIDRAAITNIPKIETCQQCHTPRLASNRCLTCHFFHPNKSRRSEMLLYLETVSLLEEVE